MIRPGERGPKVRELQQALLERGLLSPEALEESRAELYGAWTQGAVKTFQAKHGLRQDAIVGPQTWAALQQDHDGLQPSSVHVDTQAGPLMTRALGIALAELRAGVAEVPLGSNRGPRVDEYLIGRRLQDADLLCYKRYCGLKKTCPFCSEATGPMARCQGSPWCGRFALFCVELACKDLQLPSPVQGWGDLASAAKWKNQALNHGRLKSRPAPGNVGVIPSGAQAHGHVTLIASSLGDAVITVEGNSGNRVSARRRPLADFGGFVDLS